MTCYLTEVLTKVTMAYKRTRSSVFPSRTAYAAPKRSRLTYAYNPPRRVTVYRQAGQPRALTFVPRSLGTPMAVTERKYFDSEASITLVVPGASWAGAEADPTTKLTLCVPVTGNDFNNRVGRKIDVLGIRIKGFITASMQLNQTAADAQPFVRYILVQDKQTNAGQLNAEDVINSGAGSVALAMFQNPAFFGRFKVLKDKTLRLPMPTITYDGTNLEQTGFTVPFKCSYTFKKPVRVNFNATNGGTIADITDNSFHLIAGVSDSLLAPTFNYKARAVFVDP